MNNLTVVVALISRDNDYQAEQAAAVAEMASRLGIRIKVIYANNDAVNQTQQLVKTIPSGLDAVIPTPQLHLRSFDNSYRQGFPARHQES